jgi:hypothetical protein
MGNAAQRLCSSCWWLFLLAISTASSGEGAGASKQFTIAGARLIKNYKRGNQPTGFFHFRHVKITLDDGGNVGQREMNTKNVTVLCGKTPNESNAPVYNYDILKLTGTNMVLSYPEPGAGSWGTAWFWMFKTQ